MLRLMMAIMNAFLGFSLLLTWKHSLLAMQTLFKNPNKCMKLTTVQELKLDSDQLKTKVGSLILLPAS